MDVAADQLDSHKSASSEDLFLAWFLRLPHNADVAQAARNEIARLNRLEHICETTLRLRTMLEQASRFPLHARPSHRRLQH
jgi:hypothetical protein